MTDIIREDIIRIDFDIDDNPLEELQKELNDLRKQMTGDFGDDVFKELKRDTRQVTEYADDLKNTFKDLAGSTLKNLNNGLKQIGTHLSNIAKKAGGAALTGLKKIAVLSFKSLVAGVGAAGVAVAKFASMASDLEETKNKIDVAFGSGKGNFDGASKDVMEWSKTSTTAMGLAQQTALDTAALFGDMGTSMGLTKNKAADMSMALTQQAADLASFKNMSIDEVTTALNGVFTGETESLKRLGVVMTQANLEQYALTKGIKKSYKEMTEAEKVQLRYNYVMEKTKNATGDYKRTGGGFANQLRTLTENFKQLGAVIGKMPMLSLAKGMKVVNDALAEVQEILADGFQEEDTEKIMTIVDGLIDKGITALSDGIPKILPIITRVLSTVANSLLREIPKIAPVLAKSVVQLMISLGKVIYENKEELVDAAVEVVKAVIGAIYEGFTGKEMSGDMFSGFADGIKKLIPIVGGLAAAFLAFDKIKSLGSLFGGKSGGKGSFLGNLGKGLTQLGKQKPTMILKGMTNLALIFAGFAILSAAFMAIAPHIADIGDTQSLVKMIAIIGALGIVGGVLAKFGEVAGKIPVSTVVKGLANIAIILGGMTALFLVLGAVARIKFDYGRILALVGVITVIGVIGSALAILAGIVGHFNVAKVALGLANMAIVMGGLTALLLVIGAVSLIDFDYGRIIRLVGIIGAIGLIGGALGILAGILGLFNPAIVALGLANMAIVLGGVSAIIVAFGALTKIEGFSDFITRGGEILVKIFNIIGEVVGSLIGGVAEGITNSLPKIGENLTAFAESIKPMFSVFNGVDMSGIGTFFKAIGGFMLQMAGSKVLEFFAGSPDFSGVAKGLGTLAESEGVKKFFDMVNGIEEGAFKKGKLFFDCLDGISSLPNVGGFAQLFSGENDFVGVANGLSTLANNEGVKKFFVMVNGIEEGAFDKAKLFFTSLDGISNLPNVDGIGQMFSGTNDFEGVANGLTALSAEGVKNFFAMVAGIDESTFTKTTALFESLSNIGEVGKEGFLTKLGNLFSGEKKNQTSNLTTVANGLGDFAEKAGAFFEQVNALNLNNLNGLWKSLESAGKLTTENLGSVLDESMADMVEKISGLPKKMGDALKENSKDLSNGFVEMWKAAVKASVAPVNKLLEGANHILKEFGSKKRVISWTPYAKGTDGHKGGNALVNDGNGAEIVQMPNGNTFIPKGKNVFLPNAPKGMKVLPADRTAQIMGKKSPTFHYADGIGNIDIWSYYDNAKGLVNKLSENISYEGMSGLASNIGKGMVTTFTGEMPAWVDKLFDECGQSISSYVASKGVTQWLPTVVRALKMEGQYSLGNVARTLFQMRTESGGNPRAINLWDSNAKKGIPSKGLMQVIDPTFKAYARDGFNKNIYDPLSNILASIRYAVSRYGSLAKAYRGKGYANGGIARSPSVFGEDGDEMAIPLKKSKRKRGVELWRETGEIFGLSTYTPEGDSGYYSTSNTVEYNTYSPNLTFNINGSEDTRTLSRKIKQAVQEAFDDMVDGISRSNPQIREV